MKINLGYCCVSTLHKKLQCSRSSTKTYLDHHSKEHNHDYLLEKARANLKDIKTLLDFNMQEGIMAYRVPEQILPQIDLGYYSLEEVREELRSVGQLANGYRMQLSTHPSQYFVLNSLREEVVDRTIHSLNLIADTFAAMELDLTPNLTLHLGMKNGYESEQEAIDVFCRNYLRLNEAARSFLVLENDHVSFTVENCLKVHDQIGIPLVFDNKHYEWNAGNITYEEAVEACVSTWNMKMPDGSVNVRIPKLHLSSDRDTKKHAHSEYVQMEDYEKMHAALEKCCTEKRNEFNVMLECKEKDIAVLKLKKQIDEK